MRENPLAAGLGLPREPPPLSVVIFGASGDLTHRKLVPALFSLFLKGRVEHLRVIGFARREWTTGSFRAMVRSALDGEEFAAAAPSLMGEQSSTRSGSAIMSEPMTANPTTE